VLIVDGRVDPLPALSFVHRTTGAPDRAPLILFIAAAEQAAHIADLTEGTVENVLTAPALPVLVRSALHALPADEPAPSPVENPTDTTQPSAAQITPIASHPRFAPDQPDPADAVDAATVDALRALAGEDDFLEALVASFRDEVRPIMERMHHAVVDADPAGFRAALDALRRCAGNVGGVRVCKVALSLREIGEDELRQHGHDHVQRLAGELARLDGALTELLASPQARRR
jgi:hypothetical protein